MFGGDPDLQKWSEFGGQTLKFGGPKYQNLYEISDNLGLDDNLVNILEMQSSSTSSLYRAIAIVAY